MIPMNINLIIASDIMDYMPHKLEYILDGHLEKNLSMSIWPSDFLYGEDYVKQNYLSNKAKWVLINLKTWQLEEDE